MASPAASSAARLMRYPELRRSMDLLARSLVAASWRWALKASMLLLMRRDIRLLLDDGVVSIRSRGRLPVARRLRHRIGRRELEEVFSRGTAEPRPKPRLHAANRARGEKR